MRLLQLGGDRPRRLPGVGALPDVDVQHLPALLVAGIGMEKLNQGLLRGAAIAGKGRGNDPAPLASASAGGQERIRTSVGVANDFTDRLL